MILNLAKIDFCPSEGGGGKPAVVESISITENGTYTPATGVDGFAPVVVDVQPVLDQKTITVNGTYIPNPGVDGYDKVVVDVPQEVEGFTEKELTEKSFAVIDLNNSASFVASGAFSGTTTIRTITLPNCTIVNDFAFNRCYNLSSLSLPVCDKVSNSAFLSCSSLTTIELPACTSIGYETFRSCTNLQSVNLPICTTISGNAFSNCSSLATIELPACTSISDYAFVGCRTLQSVNSPICNYVGGYAFMSCSSLESIDLPFCGSISGNAFNGCSKLSIVNVGTELYYVARCGYYAFAGTPMQSSTYLGYYGSIYVPAALLEDYKRATNWVSYSDRMVGVGDPSDIILKVVDGVITGRYSGNLSRSDLQNINLSWSSTFNVNLPNVVSIQGATFGEYWNGFSKMEYVNFSNCEYIGNQAFMNCYSLNEVNFPNVSYMGHQVFAKCSSLTNVSFPTLTYMSNYAFQSCPSLQKVILPNVSFIGEYAFDNCPNLSEVYLGENYSSVVSILGGVFNGTKISTALGATGSIYVPASLVDAYKTASGDWWRWRDRIFPIPE